MKNRGWDLSPERVGLPDMQKARAFCAGFLALCYPVVQPFEQRNPPGLTPIQPRGPAAKTKIAAYGFPHTACKTPPNCTLWKFFPRRHKAKFENKICLTQKFPIRFSLVEIILVSMDALCYNSFVAGWKLSCMVLVLPTRTIPVFVAPDGCGFIIVFKDIIFHSFSIVNTFYFFLLLPFGLI